MRTVAALAALSAASCARPTPDPAPVDARAILLVTLDSTRADRGGPTRDRLAAEGTSWTRAFAASPQTLPSHATVLTGLYPPSHGVLDGGSYRMPEEVTTVAERLARAGWRTLAFPSSLSTHRMWNLDQGFELYHDPLGREPGSLDWPVQRRADRVVDDVIAALEPLDPGDPTFVWVQLYDAHWPHDGGYDAEIAFADAQLGRLLAAWDERWGSDDSWVVVTADHGEGLGDGGEQLHGFLLTDATLHVPLVVRGPGFAAAAREETVVSHVDLAPTLLGAAGLEVPPELPGRDLRRGGSGLAYSVSHLGRVAFGLAPLVSLTEAGGERLTRGAWAARGDTRLDPDDPRLQRLDALEQSLPRLLPEETTLDLQTLELLAGLGPPVTGDATDPGGAIDPRDVIDALPLAFRARDRMRTGLSYQARELLGELKLRLPDTWEVRALEARLLVAGHQLDEARVAWEDVYLRHPSGTVALQLAGLASATGDWYGAAGYYEAALRDHPDSPEALAGRARTAWMLGDDATAEAIVSELMVVQPDHPELALVQAELLLRHGELDAALAEVRAGMAALPWSPWGPHVLGGILWERGHPEPAVEALQRAVRLDPRAAAVRLRLADILLELGRPPEAVRVLAPLARAAPHDEAIQGVYEAARTAMTIDDRYRIRVNRALGPNASGR